MQTIEVRFASETDFPGIARIQLDSVEAAQWPLGDYSNYPVLAAFHEHTVVGFCAYRQLTSDQAEILNLAIDPRWRRKGIAARLLAHLLQLVSGDVFLEVAETNGAAIALYEKYGWKPVGIRYQYYQPANINGIVMKRSS